MSRNTPPSPPCIRQVLESRPVMEQSGLFTYVADIEVLHWGDHRMPMDLGVTLGREGELAVVVKPKRSYYWHTAWEIDDAEEDHIYYEEDEEE